MELRPYQEAAVAAPYDYFKSGKKGNPVIALPTGTGKSVVIGTFTHRTLDRWPNQRIMCATHSKELVKQNAAKLRNIWPDAPMGIYSAGLNTYQTHYPITFCGIDSVAKKAHIFGHQDLLLVDEAHMVDWKEKSRYRMFIDGLRRKNPKLKTIGLTATPWREGLGNIDDGDALFTDRAYSKIGVDDFYEFVDNGWLAALHPLRTETTIELAGVSKSMGDFNQEELQAASNKDEITRAAIQESLQLAGDREHWMVFCTGTDHVDRAVQLLREAGISAMGVHSKQTTAQNDLAIQMFQDGHIRALVNMGVLTTGFDAPHVDYIMMLRATMSAVLWVQMLGRGTRPKPASNKYNDCLVGDFAGNTKRLGPINDPLVPRKKGTKGGGVAPVKTCPQCDTHNHTTAKFCQNCKYEFPPPQTKLEEVASSSELMRKKGSKKAEKPEDDGIPQVDVFKVDYTHYARHAPVGKPPMMRVTYTCGLRMFSEFICIQHDGYARKKAVDWWKVRMPNSQCPTDTDEALEASVHFMSPSHIRVWHNKPYPQIMDYCWDYTAFGTQEPGADDVPLGRGPSAQQAFDDDDIPF